MVEKDTNKETLRAQAAILMSQARTEMLNIQKTLSLAAGNAPAQANLTSSAAQVAGAIAQLARAMSSPESLQAADLAALESAVQSADAGSLSSETSPAAQGGSTAAVAAAAASAATRADVESLSHDVFDQHIFDRYLHFSSAQDEAAFHAHSAAVKTYVKGQLARGTAEGNLNGGGGMMDAMMDAHAHGAGDSPDFAPRWNKLAGDTERQRAAMVAAGQSTEEFDRNLAAAVRHYLKAKGLSDAEIDQQLAAGGNPLKAAKALVADDKDGQILETQARSARAPEKPIVTPLAKAGTEPSPSKVPGSVDINAITARLQAAGVEASASTSTNPTPGTAKRSPADSKNQQSPG
jgi:hypothetical protein